MTNNYGLCATICICVMLVRYQQMLHRNLVYLATIADSSQNAQNAASVRILMYLVVAFSKSELKCALPSIYQLGCNSA